MCMLVILSHYIHAIDALADHGKLLVIKSDDDDDDGSKRTTTSQVRKKKEEEEGDGDGSNGVLVSLMNKLERWTVSQGKMYIYDSSS